MYGKYVTIFDTEGLLQSVFVSCSPTTPQSELVKRAKEILRRRME
jgi:hypothetical protein